MSQVVDFVTVSTAGLESSPHAAALAGLRANESRYFKNKYDHVAWVATILQERNIAIAARPLEVSVADVDGIHWVHVFYESGLAINVLYGVEAGSKRAVGFKLSEGMEVPEELTGFKFARQKSKLAGIMRGSFFVIKGEYDPS